MAASAADMVYSYSETDALTNWGARLAQSYDIAIYLDGGAFCGKTVKTISVPVVERPDNISDFSVWMSNALVLDDDKKNVPDVMSVELVPEYAEGTGYGTLSYTLPEGYVIPEGGVYVGYSFTVVKVGLEVDRYPVLVSAGANPGGMYVHTSKTYRQWQDRSEEFDCVSTLAVTVEGDFADYSASVQPIGNLMLKADQESLHHVTISNLGTQPIESIGYEVKVGDVVKAGEYVFAEPVAAVYNRKAVADVVFPEVPVGDYDYTVTLTTVNGNPNATDARISGTVKALEILPVKLPLMEEYTGMWCGWCPRGWMAMEKMNELYPDFVCVSYHDSDALAIKYPTMIDGFPSAVMDRSVSGDPYYGNGNTPFGIQSLWEEMHAQVTTAAIEVSAEIDETLTYINATSDVVWAVAPEDGEYRVEYVLVGDGLSDMSWGQSNYYAKYGQGAGGIYMDDFCSGGIYGTSPVYGLVYNDVALATSGLYGVAGSVASTEENVHNMYTYTFDLRKIPMAARAEKLRVVAFVLKSNSSYGTVLNSCKADVAGAGGVTDATMTAADIVSEKYYDLSGREVTNPQAGIYIKSVKYSDGRILTTKVAK